MTVDDRKQILEKVDVIVRQKYFDPKFNGHDWRSLVDKHRDAILTANDQVAFEQQVNSLLAELGTSHTSFFHKGTPVPSRNSINATFRSLQTADGPRWVFQDVQPGGPADLAGVRPGDSLISVGGQDCIPPKKPVFRMDAAIPVAVVHQNGQPKHLSLQLRTSEPKYSDCPYSEPKSVVAKTIEPGIGYLKVSMFPGIIGVDFAKDVDQAFGELRKCERLLIDLRGNPGGGIGALRLMSYLTPERIPVGYSLTRERAERGYRREDLPRFTGIPTYKWQLPLVASRFVGRDKSIVVVTEGKGGQNFHGRVVILVNEHTAGSAEMTAAFARENGLAKVVGTRTAGRLLGGKGFKIDDYRLMIPIGAYVSWKGTRFEGNGISPDVEIEWSPNNPEQQLTRAVESVRAM
ncbi:MAG TPA: S41 family peptidase [Bryobacteraceae bacterium]|nr:S41 family peptidase [Bryobacteraceae bacterium]